MKVVLLKDLTIGKQGDVMDLSAPMANYLIRCNAVAIKEEKEFKQRGRKKTKVTKEEEEEEVNDD